MMWPIMILVMIYCRQAERQVPDKCAGVTEEIPRRKHNAARQFALGRGPSSHYARCDCADWWPDSGKPTDHRGTNSVLVGISLGSVHVIIKDHLRFWKICAQCFTQQLTEGQTIDRMAACLSHLQRYHEEEYAVLSHIVTGDDTWFHNFEPESKRQLQ